MQVIRNYSGTPPPALHEGPPLHIQAGDTVELLRGDAHSLFWQVLSILRRYRFDEWFYDPLENKALVFRNGLHAFSFRNFT